MWTATTMPSSPWKIWISTANSQAPSPSLGSSYYRVFDHSDTKITNVHHAGLIHTTHRRSTCMSLYWNLPKAKGSLSLYSPWSVFATITANTRHGMTWDKVYIGPRILIVSSEQVMERLWRAVNKITVASFLCFSQFCLLHLHSLLPPPQSSHTFVCSKGSRSPLSNIAGVIQLVAFPITTECSLPVACATFQWDSFRS